MIYFVFIAPFPKWRKWRSKRMPRQKVKDFFGSPWREKRGRNKAIMVTEP